MTIKNSMDKTILVPMKCVYFFKFNMIKLTTLSKCVIFFVLQAATFEVLLVRMACLFDPESNTMMFTCGRMFKREVSQVSWTTELLYCYTRITGKCCLIYLIIQTDRAKIFRKKLPKLFWSHEQDQNIETRSNSAITRSARTSSIF